MTLDVVQTRREECSDFDHSCLLQLEGWVKFDTDSDPQMTPLDERTWYQQVMTEEGGTRPTADRFSGMAIVSERRLSHEGATNDEFEWREYTIHLVTTWRARDQNRTTSMTTKAMKSPGWNFTSSIPRNDRASRLRPTACTGAAVRSWKMVGVNGAAR